MWYWKATWETNYWANFEQSLAIENFNGCCSVVGISIMRFKGYNKSSDLMSQHSFLEFVTCLAHIMKN